MSLAPDHEEFLTSAPTMTLLDHLIELRRRLIYALVAFCAMTAVCYMWAPEIFGFLTAPLAKLVAEQGRRMIYTGLTEAFTTYLKLAMFGGVFLSFPVLAMQIWMFIAPGLYRQEKQVFLPLLVATPVLFIIGAAFAYYVVIPVAWSFFLSFETTGGISRLPIQLEAKVNEYLSTVMKLLLAFGLCFQLPVLMTLLARVGVVTAEKMVRTRKYAFLAIVIIAALLTPPDFLSPFALIVPMTLLYEISIILVRWMGKRV